MRRIPVLSVLFLGLLWMIRILSAVIFLLVLINTTFAQQADRATALWKLNCQGCHGAEGKVTAIDTPVLYNSVGRFLSVEGGREYLVSVPGVVNAPIKDHDKANLLTWIVKTLDPEHTPENFKPFTAEDVKWGRENPLHIHAAERREELIKKFEEN